jgi:hypothetical protein
MKNIYEDHFQFVHHNVSGEMVEVNMLEIVKYGATLVKNRMYLIKMFWNVQQCFISIR